MKINRSKLSQQVAQAEGKKVQVNIAQIKEVQRHVLRILALDFGDDDVLDLLRIVRIQERKRFKK